LLLPINVAGFYDIFGWKGGLQRRGYLHAQMQMKGGRLLIRERMADLVGGGARVVAEQIQNAKARR
jgi:hypothetical protein